MGINSSKEANADEMDALSGNDAVIPSRRRVPVGLTNGQSKAIYENGEVTPRTQANLANELCSQIIEQDIDNIVPNVFKWDHGGRNVYITGMNTRDNVQLPVNFIPMLNRDL